MATRVFDGPTDGEFFCAFLARLLVSTLREGDIVMIDNLASQSQTLHAVDPGRWRQDLVSAAIPAKRNSKRRMRQAQKRNFGNTLDATSGTSAETSNLANAPTASLMAVMLQSKSETPEPSQLKILNFGSVAKKGP